MARVVREQSVLGSCFPAEQSVGPPGMCSCTLTNAFHRVSPLCMCFFFSFLTPPPGQPYGVFGGLISISGWRLPLHARSLTWLKTKWNRSRKYTHQCDETQGNNSAQALSTKIVFFGCKKIERRQKKKEAMKRTDKDRQGQTRS